MIRKQVSIANYKSLADKSLRLTLDLLAHSSEDVKSVAELTETGEVTMILCKSEDLVDTIIQIAKELNPE